MRLNKNMKNFLGITVWLSAWTFLSEQARSQDQTPLPNPTLTPSWMRHLPPGVKIEGVSIIKPGTNDDYPESPSDRESYQTYMDDQVKKGNFTAYGTPVAYFTPQPTPEVPTNFKIEPGNGMAHLTWDAMPKAIGYVLYVSEDGKRFKRRFRKPFHSNEVVISVLKNNKKYYYGVVCVGPYGQETKMAIESVVPSKKSILSKATLRKPFF